LVIALSVLTLAVLGPMGMHKVDEGHVGVYWIGGSLQSSITRPGYHWKWPFASFRNIQVTMQTDQVRDIPCGTSGGVMLYFDKVEVVNRLKEEYVHATIKNYTVTYDQTWIFDKIHHAINEFCSVHTLQEVYIDKFATLDEWLSKELQGSCNYWAPGIEIIAVRVTKPRIPETIRLNYEQMEAEKTKLLIATQAQKVAEKEAQTERKRAIIEAEKNAAVSKINNEKAVSEKESRAQMSTIEDEVHMARERAFADAQFYQAKKEADAHGALFTSAYLESLKVTSLSTNTQIIFGDHIPQSLFLDGAKFAKAAAPVASPSTTTEPEA